MVCSYTNSLDYASFLEEKEKIKQENENSTESIVDKRMFNQ